MGLFSFFQNKKRANKVRPSGGFNTSMSFNYQFVFMSLKRVFFSNQIDLTTLYGNKESVQSLLFEIAKTLGRKIPNGYEKLNVAFEKQMTKLQLSSNCQTPKKNATAIL